MINSKKKGNKGELELANKLKNEYGFNCRRTQQFCGKGGESADVIGLPFIHIECKRVEKLNIDEALNQAKKDTKPYRIPCVFHRKNRTNWKVTMNLDDWMNLYGEYYSSMILAGREDKDDEQSREKKMQ